MYSVVLMTALSTSSAAPDWGCFRARVCHGCTGCWGCHGCFGCYGCHGCYGGWACHGCYGCRGCFGCHGCYGCHGCTGCWGCHGQVVMPPVEKKTEEAPVPKKPEEGMSQQNRAQLVVEMPVDAKLYIDGFLMKSTAAKRTFHTPQLNPGLTYFYEVRAEIVVDGQKFEETQKIYLRSNQTSRATFAGIETRAALALAAQARR